MNHVKNKELAKLEQACLDFLCAHSVGSLTEAVFSGSFSLYRRSSQADLYGMVDAIYTFHILGKLKEITDVRGRTRWAENVLACQDEDGWFSLLNLRGHPKEHATAYAIGALYLLECEPGECYVERIKPIRSLLSILTDYSSFLRWINTMGFSWSPRSILEKNLGWHYIWRGSHIGGGVAAIIGMTRHLLSQWWSEHIDVGQWFAWYFGWLDSRINPRTGYWQRAVWNLIYHKPTLVDMGGAAHFLWIYEALGRPFPYPEAVIRSTLTLQRPGGLYKDHPFCIDLDGNFCLIRAYLQLSEEKRDLYRERVYRAAEGNFEAIVKVLTEKPLEVIYTNSHGLPGALAALVECTKLPGFKYAEVLSGWQHPLDKVWWL